MNKLKNKRMKDIDNMSIRDVLAYGFRTANIFLVTVGIIGAVGLCILMMQMNSYRNKTVVTDLALKNVRIDVNIGLKCVREAILFGGDYVESNRETVDTYYADVNEQLALVEQIGLIDSSITENFRTDIGTWYTTANEIMDYAAKGDTETAKDLIEQKCMPTQQLLSADFNEIQDVSKKIDQRRKIINNTVFGIELVIIIVLIIVAVTCSTSLAKRIVRQIMIPVKEIEKASQELRTGNLHAQISYASDNEMGVMAKNLQEAFEILSDYVEEISSAMDGFSNGQMNIEFNSEYLGDFQSIGVSMDNFSERINEALSRIGGVAGSVNGGAEQISCAAQDVAEGAQDQAASIEELTATASEMSQQVDETSVELKEISDLVTETAKTVDEGNQNMAETKNAMSNISDKSEQIKNIIGTIDAISSQTTLLALNASIEAARAGESGRGFAVVANEVSALADQSSLAAKDIARLIDETLNAVGEGNKQVDRTSISLQEIVSRTATINGKVQAVSELAKIEAEGMKQISQAIDQVSSVVQNNSATSQETAAASQELSTNANEMIALLKDFKLKE